MLVLVLIPGPARTQAVGGFGQSCESLPERDEWEGEEALVDDRNVRVMGRIASQAGM